MFSVVHDKAIFYSSDNVGVDRILKQRVTKALFSVVDPMHGVESLWDDATDYVPEINSIKSILQSQYNWFVKSNKRYRARRIAHGQNKIFVALKRFVESRTHTLISILRSRVGTDWDSRKCFDQVG